MDFKNKVVIVTGAGRGLGKEIARQFALQGACVTLVSRTEKEIKLNAEEIISAGGRAIACAADISQEDDVKGMVKATLDAFGTVDVLVNNAAVHKAIPVSELSLDDWNYQISVNLTGTFLCSREVLPTMLSKKHGKIINISSSAARYYFPGFGAYAASKGGIVSFGHTLSEEVKGHGINVNSIYLGLTNTEYTRSRMNVDFDDIMQPDEVAKVVMFLASDEAAPITGAAIDVFGKKN
ncbi:MAG: SDR family oxidoreductase [Clostridia bacterium]|nr:SDR family oxidoreductase [Clostridia bacterium]